MVTTESILTTLKTPLSYLTGNRAGDWSETESDHVYRVGTPWLNKLDTIVSNVEVAECSYGGKVMKLKITGKVVSSGKVFAKFVKVPANVTGLFYQAYGVVDDGVIVVTVPKIEEV